MWKERKSYNTYTCKIQANHTGNNNNKNNNVFMNNTTKRTMRKCQPIATRRKYLLRTSPLRIEYVRCQPSASFVRKQYF